MDLYFRRFTLIVVAYVTVVCAIHLISFDHGTALLEWRPVRGLTIQTALILFVISGIAYKNTRGLRVAIYLAFGITLLGVLLGGILGANAIPPLQATPNVSGRPHGFSTEASTLSVQIVSSGILVVHFLRRRWQKVCVGALTCALLVYSQSKGGLVALLLCTVILVIVKSRSSFVSKLVMVCVLAPVIYLGSIFALSLFTSIIEVNDTQTIATRLSMALFALIAVMHNPFGVGFTGFFPAMPHYLPQAMETIQSWFPFPLAFAEVQEYLTPPQKDADCKTFFFDFLVYFGIPFAVIFIGFVFRLLRQLLRNGLNSLFVGLLFSALALMTYYSSLNAYTMPLLFGVSLYEVGRRENSLRLY
jgi:hypothetical protein